MTVTKSDILSVAKSVTKEWTRQRKAEERGSRSRTSRQYVYSDRVNFTDVADKILPAAYEHASGGGMLPVAKRQFYYACRKQFQEETGRQITANYFSQTLLVQYMNRNPEAAAGWKVVADPRGNLTIPNAGHGVRVPIGTLDIGNHLREAEHTIDPFGDGKQLPVEWPSLAAGVRYRDLFYVEKEGFDSLFQQQRIAERFNLAIASGKGQSTAAMRYLADMTCPAGSGRRLLILHDFDKAGFQIAARLTTNGNWAYEKDLVKYDFQNEIEVIDLGLRLADIEKYDLFWAAEDACKRTHKCKCFKCQPINQEEYGITDEEYKFLASGKRVEINALTSPQLSDFLDTKFTDLRCNAPLIPDDDTLADAYRRAMTIARINLAIEDIRAEAINSCESTTPPKSLRQQLKSAMEGTQTPWDTALYTMALTKVNRTEDD